MQVVVRIDNGIFHRGEKCKADIVGDKVKVYDKAGGEEYFDGDELRHYFFIRQIEVGERVLKNCLRYEAVDKGDNIGCDGCAFWFQEEGCCMDLKYEMGLCSEVLRSDHKHVVFKLLGERG